MSFEVSPALRARIDQEHAEYSRYVDQILASSVLMSSTRAADRTAVVATALDQGLTGTGEERAKKAMALAAVAIERLSREASDDRA